MKYFAEFRANGGSTYNREPYEFTDKREAIRFIKSLCRANHFQQRCNSSSYCVWDEKDLIVAQGNIYGFGKWSVDKFAIGKNRFIY